MKTTKLKFETLEFRVLLTSVASADKIVNARTAGDFNRDGVDDVLFGLENPAGDYLAIVWGDAALASLDEINISRGGVTADGVDAGMAITEMLVRDTHYYYPEATVAGVREGLEFHPTVVPLNQWAADAKTAKPVALGIDNLRYIFASELGYSGGLPGVVIVPFQDAVVWYDSEWVDLYEQRFPATPGSDYNGDGRQDRLWKDGNVVDIDMWEVSLPAEPEPTPPVEPWVSRRHRSVRQERFV